MLEVRALGCSLLHSRHAVFHDCGFISFLEEPVEKPLKLFKGSNLINIAPLEDLTFVVLLDPFINNEFAETQPWSFSI